MRGERAGQTPVLRILRVADVYILRQGVRAMQYHSGPADEDEANLGVAKQAQRFPEAGGKRHKLSGARGSREPGCAQGVQFSHGALQFRKSLTGSQAQVLPQMREIYAVFVLLRLAVAAQSLVTKSAIRWVHRLIIPWG